VMGVSMPMGSQREGIAVRLCLGCNDICGAPGRVNTMARAHASRPPSIYHAAPFRLPCRDVGVSVSICSAVGVTQENAYDTE